MKDIISTLDGAEVEWQKQLKKYEAEIQEDLDLFDPVRGGKDGDAEKSKKFAMAQKMGKLLERI